MREDPTSHRMPRRLSGRSGLDHRAATNPDLLWRDVGKCSTDQTMENRKRGNEDNLFIGGLNEF